MGNDNYLRISRNQGEVWMQQIGDRIDNQAVPRCSPACPYNSQIF